MNDNYGIDILGTDGHGARIALDGHVLWHLPRPKGAYAWQWRWDGIPIADTTSLLWQSNRGATPE